MAQPPPGEPSELDPEGAPALPAGSLAAVAEPEPEADPSRHASYREIGRLSWPVMVSLGLANLVGLVDIAMVGRLGPDATAAVGYATQFHFLSQSVLFAVGFACTALMSRAIGAGNRLRARGAFAASLLVSFGSALAIIAFVLAPGAAWLRLLGADPAVATLTLPYLQLVIGSTLFLSVAMTFEFGMRANRDTRTPLRIAAVVAAVKIALNAVLIFGEAGFPRLELVGAGIATVVSQVVGLALFWLVAARAPREGMLRPAWQAARPIVADVVRLALPGLGERLAMNLALLVYFRVLAEYGTDAVAAYTVGIRILSFSWLPGSGFGIASATLVGQALGAGRPDAAVRAGWRTTRLALGVALALGLAGVLQRDRPRDPAGPRTLPALPRRDPAVSPGAVHPGRRAPGCRRHPDPVLRRRGGQLAPAGPPRVPVRMGVETRPCLGLVRDSRRPRGPHRVVGRFFPSPRLD